MLRDLDALIVVSSPWVDGASAAGQTMEWFANRGYTGLLHRTVVVLNDSDGHADKRTRVNPRAAVRQSRSGRRRGSLRLAPASRRRDRRDLGDVAVDQAALHRDHRGARRALRRPPPTDRGTAGDDGPRTGTQPRPAAPRRPVEVPPSCRVSILAGDSHQIDLVLPSAAPLNTLVDPTVIAINKVLRGRGAAELPPAAYEFARAAGMSALASDVSLAGHNIADGDVLALVPAGRAERYGPVVENVSTALAQYASDHFVRVTAQTALAVAVVIIGGALGVASMLLWRLRWAHESALLVPILFAAVTIGLLGDGRDRRAGRRGPRRHRRRRLGCARHRRAWPPRPFRPAARPVRRTRFSPPPPRWRECG